MGTKIAITGAGGFLGWHTRVAAHSLGWEVAPIKLGDQFDMEEAKNALAGASRLIHIAGVNRADSDEDVAAGNERFAMQLVELLRDADEIPPVVSYANSIQSGNETAYGQSKEAAGYALETVTRMRHSRFENHLLPNLFGEHGEPFYNSVVATFCHLIANEKQPDVHGNKELTLFHAQDAADLLLGVITPDDAQLLYEKATVQDLANTLTNFWAFYDAGEIPNVSSRFHWNLFNTYRSYLTDVFPQVHHKQHADERGSFVELVRSQGGASQASFSTTAPGVLRGGHYHRRKIERFTVIQGEALIQLRRLFTNEVIEVRVSGDELVSVDMPTMWTHNIRNVGEDTLFTHFWTNDPYNPKRPDTVMEDV